MMIYFFKLLLRFFCAGNLCLSFSVAEISSDDPLSISFFPPPDSVIINQTLTIRCHIDLRADDKELLARSSMFLYCPIKARHIFCFQNCKPATDCRDDADEHCEVPKELADVQCRIIKEAGNKMTYEYTMKSVTSSWLTISREDKKTESGFACYSGGLRSRWIQLKEKMTIEDKDLPSATYPTSRSTPRTTYPEIIHTIASYPESDESEVMQLVAVNENIVPSLTKENIIVATLIGITLSLLLNAFWCIRHVLIRHYTDRDKYVPMENLFCMSREIRNARQFRKLYNQKSKSDCKTGEKVHSSGIPTFINPQTHGYHNTIDTSFVEATYSDDSFGVYNGVPRAFPEGKATNSTISNSCGRNSSHELSAMSTPIQLYNAAGQPVPMPGGLYSLNPLNPRMTFQTPQSQLKSQYIYLSQQKLQQLHLDVAGNLYRLGHNFSDIYDSSQKSVKVYDPSKQTCRQTDNQRDVSRDRLHRPSSKETILSGFIIESQRGPRDSLSKQTTDIDSQVMSDLSSLDEIAVREYRHKEPTRRNKYRSSSLQNSLILDRLLDVESSQCLLMNPQQDVRRKIDEESRIGKSEIQDLKIIRTDVDKNGKLLRVQMNQDGSVTQFSNPRLSSDLQEESMFTEDQKYNQNGNQEGTSGVRNWLENQ